VSCPSVFTIRIDGESRPATDGQPAQPDTFAWGVFRDVINPDGTTKVATSARKFQETPHTGIQITGGWQELANGVKVRFGSTTGHNKGSTWFVSYVGPGESFDAERITIVGTRTLNPTGAAHLLGHPSHRGRLRDVKCNHNYMETAVTSIEPNFNLDGYEVIGNIMKSGGLAIHCWRHSRGGVIADNLRIHDNTGQPVVVVNAPRGWQNPEPPVLRNNRNPLSEAAATKAAP